jgi:Fur family zinc uptake transcriptional regulator
MTGKPMQTSPKDTLPKLMTHLETIASMNKVRLTPIRRHVYKCLAGSPHPLGAYEILDMLNGIGASKPPTVYRALDWLLDLGVIRKISSVSKFVVLPDGQSHDPVAVLLCRECGKAEILKSDHGLTSIIDAAKSQGLQDVQATLEIVGQCRSPV